MVFRLTSNLADYADIHSCHASKSPADQRRELNSIIQETVSVSLRNRLESLLLDIDKEIQALPSDKKPEAAASTRPAHTEIPATEFVAIERFAWD